MENVKDMTLYQKLHVIQSRILGLGKNKKSFGYDYVNGSKVLEHIKPLMNELGILLKQEVLSIENTRMDYTTSKGAKTEILSKVMMRFTWIDAMTGEMDENMFGANGQNDFEKGLGSALTYAERYFLLKYFHIPTDEDDIDNEDRRTSEPVPLQPLSEARLKAAIDNKAEKLALDGDGVKWTLSDAQKIALEQSLSKRKDND